MLCLLFLNIMVVLCYCFSKCKAISGLTYCTCYVLEFQELLRREVEWSWFKHRAHSVGQYMSLYIKKKRGKHEKSHMNIFSVKDTSLEIKHTFFFFSSFFYFSLCVFNFCEWGWFKHIAHPSGQFTSLHIYLFLKRERTKNPTWIYSI